MAKSRKHRSISKEEQSLSAWTCVITASVNKNPMGKNFLNCDIDHT